jgi:hypothetical protein
MKLPGIVVLALSMLLAPWLRAEQAPLPSPAVTPLSQATPPADPQAASSASVAPKGKGLSWGQIWAVTALVALTVIAIVVIVAQPKASHKDQPIDY